MSGLQALEARVRWELQALEPARRDWTRPRKGPDGSTALDVAIVGAGQSGLGAAFALQREQVRNILVLDENPAGLEGPWVTYARMITLRTPKHLTGIDMGVPSLTFRAWWEALNGPAGWEALGKIPRVDWMDYLRWFRRVLDLPVRNDARVTLVEPADGGLHRLSLATGEHLYARKVVFATGIQGGGDWHVPSFIRESLPRRRYSHSAEAVDYAALKGRRIGILGGGASAFDNAQHALGLGVAEAHVFIRRRDLPRINPIRHMEVSGLIRHFAALDDARKYRAIHHFTLNGQPPTNDTFARAAAFPGFRLHAGSPWLAARESERGAVVTTPKGELEFDHLILSTGLVTDVALRPELASLAGDIALWRDRYSPPPQLRHPLVEQHPYLGPAFEFTGRTPEGARRLRGLFAFNYSALVSLGLSAAALSGLKTALPKLASGVAAQLFLDDQDELLDAFYAYDEQEFVAPCPVD